MKELGTGFCFIGKEYPIKLGDRYNYVDLLLYNIEFNCYVVIELKVTRLKKEHIGQIEVYMNYIDKNLKKSNQDRTIGIIVCKENNEYIIEYCSDKRITARIYELVQKEGIINEYSKKLTLELGKGYNVTNLKRYRQFYLLIQKGARMGHQLSWSKYVKFKSAPTGDTINTQIIIKYYLE